MEAKFVLIIQCEIAKNRCSGYACTSAFYDRTGAFDGYADDIQYMTFTCGGCCGKGVAARLEHFTRRMNKDKKYTKDDVAIHLSSCMVTDNHHYDRCPHVDYIKRIISKHGYENVIEQTYISKTASRKREEGLYQIY